MIGLALSVALVASSPLAARVAEPRAIDLHAGVNRLGPLGPGGAEVLIVSATPNVEDGDQVHTAFMVLVRPTGKNWRLAPFCRDSPTDGGCPDTVVSAQHDGENGTFAIAFARAMVDKRSTLVLLQARRDMAHASTNSSPVPVEVRVSALTHEVGFGETFFREVESEPAPGCYVDASLALNVVFGLPLPEGYDGPRTPAACPAASAHNIGR